MEEFLRGFWLVDAGSWALFLITGLGLGWWAGAKRLASTRAFLNGMVVTAIAMFATEAALHVLMTGSLRPLDDFAVTSWCTLILPRMGLWSVITGLITLTVSKARIPFKSASHLT